jgi:propanediol dehydratase large subunit
MSLPSSSYSLEEVRPNLKKGFHGKDRPEEVVIIYGEKKSYKDGDTTATLEKC